MFTATMTAEVVVHAAVVPTRELAVTASNAARAPFVAAQSEMPALLADDDASAQRPV
jgi:hypothetical protein